MAAEKEAAGDPWRGQLGRDGHAIGFTLDGLVKVWSANGAASVGKPDYLDYVWPRLNAYSPAGGLPGGRPVNFERVLGEMVALTHWLVPAPYGNALSAVVGAPRVPAGMTFSTPGAYAPAIDITYDVVTVMKELARHMRGLSRTINRSAPAFVNYSRLFAELRRSFDLGIYNLNYDTVALNAWPGVFTGFGTGGKFDPRAVHERVGWEFLYHLHGSVHHTLTHPFGNEILWQSDLAGNFDDGDTGRSGKDVSDGKSLPKTSLIAGGFKLDQLLAEPFQTYYAALVRRVHAADAILLGGYGFGDTHINEALAHRVTSAGPRPRVAILDYARPATDPMECRGDEWCFQVCKTLEAEAKEFREPGYATPPDIADLVARTGFEVNGPQRIAIWHGGFTAAAKELHRLVPWLQEAADDRTLAGLP